MTLTLKSRFGPFLPDIPAFGSEGSDKILNVLPAKGGYRPLRRVVPVTEAVGGDVLAAIFARSSSGTSFGFAATATDIELLDNDSFRSASRASGYSTSAGGTWFFARFEDILVGTNYDNVMQSFNLLTDSSFNDFPSGAPKSRYLGVINNFLIALFLDEGGTISPTGVRWSALNDPLNFPDIDIVTNDRSDEAIQTLSDRQVLATEYGDITGVATGLASADGVIFQESGITAMNFTGGPEIFSFDVLEGARGCVAPHSIVRQGGRAFYLNDTGLHVTDGVRSIEVGASRVDDFLFEAVSTDRLQDVQAGIDVRDKYIYWSLPGFSDRTLIYNYDINEFSSAEDLGVSLFVRSLSVAPTAESIASQFDGSDNMGLSFDDPQFSGSNIPVFSAVTKDNRFGPFAGSPLPATLKTKEVEPFDDARGYLQFSRPFIDTDQVTVRPVTRETLQDFPQDQNGSRVIAGIAPSRVTSRYWALQIETDDGAEWTFCQGIQAIMEEAGNRDPDDIAPTFEAPDFMLISQNYMLLDHRGRPLLVVAQDEVVVDAEAFFIVTTDGDFLVDEVADFIVTSISG